MIEDAHAVGRTQRRHHLALIDLDSVCWANPARDIGNFLAYLTWKALRQPQHAGFIRCAQREFLAGYGALRTLPDVGWLSRYQAASILKIVGRRYSGLTYQEWPLTGRLLDKAVSMNQKGAHPCSN
jgi:aminoglycoside phosphotransferase (APT) family kinase protein